MMKTILKVFLTVTFPLWIFPTILLMGCWCLYSTVSDIVDNVTRTTQDYDPM